MFELKLVFLDISEEKGGLELDIGAGICNNFKSVY